MADMESLPPHLRPPEQTPTLSSPIVKPTTDASSLQEALQAVESPNDLWCLVQARWEVGVTPHLNELRHRLLWSIVGFSLFTVGSYWVARPTLRYLQSLAPAGTQFIQLAPTDALFAVFSLMLLMGSLLSLPLWLWHVLRFFMPALTKTEKQFALPSLILSSIGAGLGLWLGLAVLLPTSLNVLLSFAEGIATPQISLNSFIEFCITMLGVLALCFQMPFLAFLLGRIGILHRAMLQQRWRESFVAIVIIAAIATPTQDPLTLGIVSLALILLYAVCIVVVPAKHVEATV
jgi:sec-independent protein translocase protein TatC